MMADGQEGVRHHCGQQSRFCELWAGRGYRQPVTLGNSHRTCGNYLQGLCKEIVIQSIDSQVIAN